MKLIISLTIFTTFLALTPAAEAVVIKQGSAQDFVKFQAGDYKTLTGTTDLEDQGDGTLKTIDSNDSYDGTVTYEIEFQSTGDYYLYFNNSNDGGGSDSLFLEATASGGIFGDEPETNDNDDRWNGFSSGDNWDLFVQDGEYENNNVKNTSIAWNVSSAGSYTVIFKNREPDLVWTDFVFSKQSDLTTTQLDDLSYSTVIPEPSAAALLLLAGSAFMLRRRRAR